MRRGLIKWDPDELPVSVLRQRTQRLQQAITGAGLDAVILYTNFIRCAAVSWLTGFSPYWGDGVVIVQREGEPLLSTMLSKRMEGWIQGVMPAAKVATSPAPGRTAAQRLADAGARRIGILELDDFPSGLFADLSAGLPQAEFLDASRPFGQARSPADDAERRLLSRADQIASEALAQLKDQSYLTAGAAAAKVEEFARLQGAEEIYVAIAADLDVSGAFLRASGDHPLGRRYAVRATLAYKGSWIRRIRTCSQDAHDHVAIRRADGWFAETLATGASEPPVCELPEARLLSWVAEAATGTRPLAVINAVEANRPVVITASLDIGGLRWCGAALMPCQ